VSSVSSTSSSTSGTLGDAPPVSFPGVASGIDYNAIIEKYTAETLSQEAPLQAQVSNLNNENTAILKIKTLLGSVQDSLTALSNPTIFGAYTATPSNTADGSTAATLTQLTGSSAVAGTYTINAQTAATATVITNNPDANGALDTTDDLAAAGTAITPTNGTSGNGSITINGTQVNYNVNTQSLTTILNNIQSQVAGVTYSINSTTGTVTLNGVTTLGSGADSGNLEQVLKLDTAQLSGGTVTSSSSINGINEYDAFNSDNNAGFATTVTAGTFTINGVSFTVNPATDSLSDIISEINSSTAGVVAQYNTSTSQITLTSSTAGPESILLGASGDTSNFLTATGLKTGTTTAGTQASLTYTANNVTQTVYSSTNTFTNIVPGFSLVVNNSSPSSFSNGQSTYYTVTVASDPTQAESAINTFIKNYNTAIQTLNNDLQAPTVSAGTTSSDGLSTSTSSGGGILYGNFEVEELKNQLVSLVSGFIPSGSNQYNSLSTVGITLNTASQTVGEQSDSSDASDSSSTASSTDSGLTVTGGTDGTLAALDTTTFAAAYAANTSAVQSLFTLIPKSTGTSSQSQANFDSGYGASASAGFAYQLGSLISNANGLTTFLQNSAITPADLSNVTLTTVVDSNNQQIDSIDEQITTITTEANNQADQLRQQFSASESQIAELQALQQQIAAIGH
jgi:flagellar hook-associated protein 2